MPWVSRMRTNERTRLRGSMGLPVRVVKPGGVGPGGAELYPVGFLLLLACGAAYDTGFGVIELDGERVTSDEC